MDECPVCRKHQVSEPKATFGGGEAPPGWLSPTGGGRFQYATCGACKAKLRRSVSDEGVGDWQVQEAPISRTSSTT